MELSGQPGPDSAGDGDRVDVLERDAGRFDPAVLTALRDAFDTRKS